MFHCKSERCNLNTTGLQIQRKIAGTISPNDNVIFDTLLNSKGSVFYDSLTGQIVINKNGMYFISWSVSTQSSLGSNNLIFSIQSSNGDDLIGNSSINTGEVIGFDIIQVDSAPIALSLINKTSNDIVYSTLVPIVANLVLFETPECTVNTSASGATGITGSTGITGATWITGITEATLML